MNNFWDISANVQILTALVLIVLLLLYIAFKVSNKDKTSHRSRASR